MKPVTLGLAAAIAISSIVPGATGTASAAPLATSALSLKEAVSSDVIDVRRRRGHRGGGVAAGIALGLLGAGVAAHQYHRHYRHDYYPHYGYGRRGCVMHRSHERRNSVVFWHCV